MTEPYQHDPAAELVARLSQVEDPEARLRIAREVLEHLEQARLAKLEAVAGMASVAHLWAHAAMFDGERPSWVKLLGERLDALDEVSRGD